MEEHEQQYRALYDEAPIAYFLVGSDARIKMVNRRAAELLGYSAEDLIERPVFELYADTPEGKERAQGVFERFLAGGEVRGEELEMRRADGGSLWISLTVRAVRDARGEVVASRSMAVDITDRKRAEEMLRESEERFRAFLEFLPDSLVIVDKSGYIEIVNAQVEKVFGYIRDKLLGRPVEILVPERFRDVHVRHREDYYSDPRPRPMGVALNLFGRREDGSEFPAEVSLSPVRMRDETHIISIIRDITGQKQLERQLFQAQKMEAVGTLASGIAHNFNNLLTSIIGFAQLALMDEGLSPQAQGYIAKIPEQGRRAAQLISQLLTFSRKAITERQPMSLAPLVKETMKMLERALPETTAIRVRVSGEISPVNADPTQIQQIIMNLCINAFQAMPRGGELTVGLEDVTLDEAYCQQYAYARPGKHVCLSVQDTGVGMTPEVQAHLFEPFFTTKGVGEGTGLGLAVVYGIVKGHEGHINVYSKVGKGSEFKVYLPATEAETTRRVVSTEGSPPGGTETLLLVEDEATVLATGRAMLERLGYRVLTASNGEEALGVYRARRGEIALVLTDAVMPGMGGEGLYEALVKMEPGVKVALMSGYCVKEEVAGLWARGLRGFVRKPFDLHRLGKAVRQALDRA